MALHIHMQNQLHMSLDMFIHFISHRYGYSCYISPMVFVNLDDFPSIIPSIIVSYPSWMYLCYTFVWSILYSFWCLHAWRVCPEPANVGWSIWYQWVSLPSASPVQHEYMIFSPLAGGIKYISHHYTFMWTHSILPLKCTWYKHSRSAGWEIPLPHWEPVTNQDVPKARLNQFASESGWMIFQCPRLSASASSACWLPHHYKQLPWTLSLCRIFQLVLGFRPKANIPLEPAQGFTLSWVDRSLAQCTAWDGMHQIATIHPPVGDAHLDMN